MGTSGETWVLVLALCFPNHIVYSQSLNFFRFDFFICKMELKMLSQFSLGDGEVQSDK